MNIFLGINRIFAMLCVVLVVNFCTSNAEETDSIKSEKPLLFKMQKSPTGAIVRSLILPGWGQYYVESYWKIPVFLGAAGTCAYFIIDNNNSFNDKKAQIASLSAIDPNDPYIDLYKRQREVYRDNRDQAAFFLAGVYILAAVDAYVGAHLFDFNVNDQIALNVSPGNRNSYINLFLSIKL